MSSPPPTRPASHYLRIPPWRRWVVQFDISHNAIALAFFAFTSMWQTACQHFAMITLPYQLSTVMYIISCIILSVAIILFCLRASLYPSAYLADFRHPRLANFFFMPVMIGALCVLTTPRSLRSVLQFELAFYTLSAYQIALTLYFYGEWLFNQHPTAFIHPLVFMQTIGFFLLANIGASAHLFDAANAMFSVGCLFWLLVFITNFQHISPALDKRSEKPQPTFFLFIAPPAQAAISVVLLTLAESARGTIDASRLLALPERIRWPPLAQGFMYVDLFLYLLMFRLFPTFWTTKFAISWWAYIFPLSAAAGMCILRYTSEGGLFWGVLSAVLGLIATVAMAVVLCFTVWAMSTGRVPHNPDALEGYYNKYFGDNTSGDEERGARAQP